MTILSLQMLIVLIVMVVVVNIKKIYQGLAFPQLGLLLYSPPTNQDLIIVRKHKSKQKSKY